MNLGRINSELWHMPDHSWVIWNFGNEHVSDPWTEWKYKQISHLNILELNILEFEVGISWWFECVSSGFSMWFSFVHCTVWKFQVISIVHWLIFSGRHQIVPAVVNFLTYIHTLTKTDRRGFKRLPHAKLLQMQSTSKDKPAEAAVEEEGSEAGPPVEEVANQPPTVAKTGKGSKQPCK